MQCSKCGGRGHSNEQCTLSLLMQAKSCKNQLDGIEEVEEEETNNDALPADSSTTSTDGHEPSMAYNSPSFP